MAARAHCPMDHDAPEPEDDWLAIARPPRPVFSASCAVPARAARGVFWWGLGLPCGVLAVVTLLHPSALLPLGPFPYIPVLVAFLIVWRARSRVIIGDDGVTFAWWGARTYLPLADIRSVSMSDPGQGRGTADHTEANWVTIGDAAGREWNLCLFSPRADSLRALWALDVRLRAFATLAAAESIADHPYRQLRGPVASALEIAVDPRAAIADRRRALSALPARLDSSIRDRLWNAARGTAHPMLREALGRAYWSSEPDDDATP
jgi:hypothetical protein